MRSQRQCSWRSVGSCSQDQRTGWTVAVVSLELRRRRSNRRRRKRQQHSRAGVHGRLEQCGVRPTGGLHHSAVWRRGSSLSGSAAPRSSAAWSRCWSATARAVVRRRPPLVARARPDDPAAAACVGWQRRPSETSGHRSVVGGAGGRRWRSGALREDTRDGLSAQMLQPRPQPKSAARRRPGIDLVKLTIDIPKVRYIYIWIRAIINQTAAFLCTHHGQNWTMMPLRRVYLYLRCYKSLRYRSRINACPRRLPSVLDQTFLWPRLQTSSLLSYRSSPLQPWPTEVRSSHSRTQLGAASAGVVPRREQWSSDRIGRRAQPSSTHRSSLTPCSPPSCVCVCSPR